MSSLPRRFELLAPTLVKMLLRAVLNVVTCVWICRSTIACCVSAEGCVGGGGLRATCFFFTGFCLLVSTVIGGSVPGVDGACGVVCSSVCAGGFAGGGVCARPEPRIPQSETSAEPVKRRARPIDRNIVPPPPALP